MAAAGLYPVRLEGYALSLTTKFGRLVELYYRGRFAPLPASAGGAPPQYMVGQSCETVTAAIQSAPADTLLVSLQRFYDSFGTAYYQAVWSTPIPQLPSP
jgi:hypothetical protein